MLFCEFALSGLMNLTFSFEIFIIFLFSVFALFTRWNVKASRKYSFWIIKENIEIETVYTDLSRCLYYALHNIRTIINNIRSFSQTSQSIYRYICIIYIYKTFSLSSLCARIFPLFEADIHEVNFITLNQIWRLKHRPLRVQTSRSFDEYQN